MIYYDEDHRNYDDYDETDSNDDKNDSVRGTLFQYKPTTKSMLPC